MAGSGFGVADYAVCSLVLFISAGIGVYYRCTGGKQKTAAEYLLAGRNMSILPVAFSLMASFMSAVSLLGVSAENYMYGTMYMVANISYLIVTPLATNLYLPVFYNLGATSAYEYLERRFGVTSRLVASLAFSLQMILYMGVVLYAPSLALEAVTGLPKTWSILCVGLACTFYSTMGGLKAVLITDVFQSLLMFAAVYSVIISAWIDQGSLFEIWHIANKHKRIDFFNTDTDPSARHTWWSLIIGGGITHLTVYGVNQAQVQRYLAVKDLATAQRAIWLSLPILSLMSLSTGFAGLAIFSRYTACDPLSAGKISSQDQLMPYYVLDTMSGIPGLAGLFVSGIFSAALSTISSAVNSLAAVSLEDYIKPAYKRIFKVEFPDNGSSYKAKIVSVIYGLVSVAMAFLAQCLGSVLQASLTILGAVGGPLLGLFSLGMFFPSANETGALSGLAVSLLFSLWLGFAPKPAPLKLPLSTDSCINNFTIRSEELHVISGTSLREDQYFYLYRISYLWLSVLSVVICLVVGYIVSFLARHVLHLHSSQSDCMDPELFVPPIASYLKKRRGHFCLKVKQTVDDIQCNNFRKPIPGGDQDSLTSCEEMQVLQTPV